MTPKRIVIIGGSAAGAKAAAKARRLDQKADITIVQKSPDLSIAACGYPYYVQGVFKDRKLLLATPTGVVRDPVFFQKTKNIRALISTEVLSIQRDQKSIECKNLLTNDCFSLPYDRLIIATGASAPRLPVPGNNLEGITTLLDMADTDYLHKIVEEKAAQTAVIIGGGLIGVETCEALRTAGLNVILVEMMPSILPFLDPQLAKLTENHLKSKGVEIKVGIGLKGFLGKEGKLTGVQLQDDQILECQLAVVAIGVRPNIKLAKEADLAIGELGGILVDEQMRTSDSSIFAAGDCVEIRHKLTGKNVLAPMGDLANLQGRIAGENAALDSGIAFSGTIHTTICKVFDYKAGSTGLSEESARKNGFQEIVTALSAGSDKPGFMGAGLLISKIIINKPNGQILGYQCVGTGDVSRQIATAAMAIQAKMTIPTLTNLDLPYAPPFSPAIDHFILSAHIAENKMKGRLKTISAAEVYARLADGNKPFFLDGRGPDEYEVLQLGIGEHFIPLGALRNRLHELPPEKDCEIVCFCKISLRGYEAALILEDAGWTNVKVMEGGIMAWPYARAK